jgi:hypothetical protein
MSHASLFSEVRVGSAPVCEVPLLLSLEQLSALEQAAHARGVTAAELLRTILRESLQARPADGRRVPRPR